MSFQIYLFVQKYLIYCRFSKFSYLRIIPFVRNKVIEAAGWIKKCMKEPDCQVISVSRQWWNIQCISETFIGLFSKTGATKYYMQCAFLYASSWWERSAVRPVCQTATAYSRTGRIMLIQKCNISSWGTFSLFCCLRRWSLEFALCIT